MAFQLWYYGLDTNSAPPCPCRGAGPPFYIGRLGGGVRAGGTGFMTPTAKAVGPRRTFPYWDLEGPGATASGDTPSSWGAAQARAFLAARRQSPAADGATLFADIERANPGWGGVLGDNRAVLASFLRVVARHNGGDCVSPGIYISTDTWDGLYGQDYEELTPFVFWLAGTDCPEGCGRAEAAFNQHHVGSKRGGMRVMIWQHTVSGCRGASQDVNITPYRGYQRGRWLPTGD